jgi:hypothetical protein
MSEEDPQRLEAALRTVAEAIREISPSAGR